ncbi:MAG: hypothetical protein JWO67_4175 [Streptosporangiaceae bacterium]|nr:hypothetical protein [Streptosporangiaceae bacterium]
MAKRLKAFVHVHQDDGTVNVYGPEDDVPKEDAAKIGDHAWTDEELEYDSGPAVRVDDGQPKKSAPRRRSSGS